MSCILTIGNFRCQLFYSSREPFERVPTFNRVDYHLKMMMNIIMVSFLFVKFFQFLKMFCFVLGVPFEFHLSSSLVLLEFHFSSTERNLKRISTAGSLGANFFFPKPRVHVNCRYFGSLLYNNCALIKINTIST